MSDLGRRLFGSDARKKSRGLHAKIAKKAREFAATRISFGKQGARGKTHPKGATTRRIRRAPCDLYCLAKPPAARRLLALAPLSSRHESITPHSRTRCGQTKKRDVPRDLNIKSFLMLLAFLLFIEP